MYPTSTPASLLEERERSVCNMHRKVRLPTNYSVFSLIFIPWSIALWFLPWDPFRPVYPIETAEATLLSIFLAILLHYIPARHLRKIKVSKVSSGSEGGHWLILPVSTLALQPSSVDPQLSPGPKFCKKYKLSNYLCGFLILQLSTMYSVHMQFPKAEW